LLERSSLGPFLEARFEPLLLGGSLGWTSVPARPCCISDLGVEVSKLDAGYEGLSAGLWLGFEKALSESYSYRFALRSDFLFNDMLQITADLVALPFCATGLGRIALARADSLKIEPPADVGAEVAQR
jgi:hypothetical protein